MGLRKPGSQIRELAHRLARPEDTPNGPNLEYPARTMAPSRIVPLIPLCLLVGVGGCTTTRDAAVPLVRVHAAKDLKCPDDKIEVEPQLGGRYVASGCGKRLTYHSACEHLHCTVGQAGEEPPAWRGRPDPEAPQ